MRIDFPFRLDGRGRTARVDDDESTVHDLIEQLLFTAPGERVNRPSFGSGVRELVFAPSGGEVAAATRFLVQSALQQWLGDRIEVDSVDAESVDGTLTVAVAYRVRRTGERVTAELRRPA